VRASSRHSSREVGKVVWDNCTSLCRFCGLATLSSSPLQWLFPSARSTPPEDFWSELSGSRIRYCTARRPHSTPERPPLFSAGAPGGRRSELSALLGSSPGRERKPRVVRAVRGASVRGRRCQFAPVPTRMITISIMLANIMQASQPRSSMSLRRPGEPSASLDQIAWALTSISSAPRIMMPLTGCCRRFGINNYLSGLGLGSPCLAACAAPPLPRDSFSSCPSGRGGGRLFRVAGDAVADQPAEAPRDAMAVLRSAPSWGRSWAGARGWVTRITAGAGCSTSTCGRRAGTSASWLHPPPATASRTVDFVGS